MRKSLINNLWCLVFGGAIFAGMWLFSGGPMAIGQPQQTTPKDPKPPLNRGQQQATPSADDQKAARKAIEKLPLKITKAAEPTLEEMLNKALKDNPDIKVAEAKVREADAELNRTRLQVTQKVLASHHSREAQKAVVKVAEDEVARVRKLDKANVISQQDVTQAEDRLAQAKAKLAEIEAEMPYLLGEQREVNIVRHFVFVRPEVKQAERELAGALKVYPVEELVVKVRNVPGTTLEKIRKALETPVAVDYKQMNAAGVLKDLEKKVPGISFHIAANTSFADLHLDGKVPLAAALQMVEDTFTELFEGGASGRCSFAIRDYGILFTGADRIPPGAIKLDDLLRGKGLGEGPWSGGDKKPAEDKK